MSLLQFHDAVKRKQEFLLEFNRGQTLESKK